MPSQPAIGGYSKLLDCPHAVFVLEVTPEARFRVVAFNKEEERLVGVSNDAAAGKYVDDLLPESVTAPLLGNYRRCIEAGEPISYDEEIDLPAGRRLCATTLVPVADESGRIFRIIGIARDVTREKIALGELRASEERFRALAENIREVFWMTTPTKSELLYVSPGYEAIWGRTCESLRAAPGSWLEAIDPADRASVEAWTSRQQDGPTETTYRILRPDGSTRWIRDRSFPVRDGEGTLVSLVGLADDITTVIRTEERLAQSQKFEALGRLAGGVAHDFNNILSVILTHSYLVLDDLAPGTLRSDLEVVCQAAGRASELTRQLLAFSHQQVHRPRVMDLGQAVSAMNKMLSKILGENIALSLPIAPPGCRILADPGQIERVVLNLAMNGRDAMSQQGTLTIAVTRAAVDAGRGGSIDVEPGDYVLLTVADNGVGMSAETRRRIFEPFFTTKGKGKGTGLGLSTVFGIVEQTGGVIRVESEPGRGSVFRLFFPVVAGAASVGVSAPPPAGAAGGTETILLVEDDPQVLAAASTILRRSGYSVLEANNAGEALLIAEQHEGAIDLLLTDIVMPRMTGAQLAMRLAPLRPHMKALYLSGGAGESSRGLAPGADTIVVEKPFTPGALTRKVREVLG
jgi:two-component system cell cycle sensor histidine kinase/response regulator CckA